MWNLGDEMSFNQPVSSAEPRKDDKTISIIYKTTDSTSWLQISLFQFNLNEAAGCKLLLWRIKIDKETHFIITLQFGGKTKMGQR